MENLLFVSAFIDLNEERSLYRTVEKSFELFKPIADSGINILCFLSRKYSDVKFGDNVTTIYLDLEDLDTYKTVKQIRNITLPKTRNMVKDTENFMILMNSKFEFMERAIKLKPLYLKYAWIDFNICHVFKDPFESINYLKSMSEISTKIKNNCVHFPGCWLKGTNITTLFEIINWRFCGGFFIGDSKSILKFYNIFKKQFPLLISKYNLTWETNIWTYLEFFDGSFNTDDIEWFLADHDDSIIKVRTVL